MGDELEKFCHEVPPYADQNRQREECDDDADNENYRIGLPLHVLTPRQAVTKEHYCAQNRKACENPPNQASLNPLHALRQFPVVALVLK